MFHLMQDSNGKKSITIISGGIYPFKTGGAEIFIYFLVKHLAENYKVILISGADPCIEGVEFVRIRDIKPFRLFYPLQLFFLLVRKSYSSSAMYTSFMKASWSNYFPVALYSVLSGVPYSFTIHGGGLSAWNFKFPYIFFFKKAKAVSGVSQRICDEYHIRTGVEIINLPPLIPFLSTTLSKDSIKIKYRIPGGKKIFLFVGSLKPLKNPQHILEAMKVLGKDYIEEHDLYFVFAGDGILKEHLKKYCVTYKFEKYVSFLGNIPIKSINETYKMADYYIICSDFEGTPISLLEAMFNNLPILASNSPGINNILTHNKSALLYDPKNPMELVVAIKSILINPVKENELKNRGKKDFLEKFDYKTIISDYEKMILNEKNN